MTIRTMNALFPAAFVPSVFALVTFWITYQSGAKIENFTLPDVVSNRPVSLTDYNDKKGVVLVFSSNYCPFSKLYEDRIQALVTQYDGQGIQFIRINSNTSADNVDDSVEEMAKHAREKGWTVPYLADKTHQVSDQFGATKTPEVFVLQNTGAGAFTLKYRGAVDDNPQVPSAVSNHYLKDAVAAIVQQKNVTFAEKRPVGCMIKKE